MKSKGKVVLITGSSRGLGRALACLFARRGYDIIIHGRDNKELKKVKNEVLKKGVNCYVVRGDLKYRCIIRQLTSVAREKDLNVLVNNAALGCPFLPLEKISDKQIDDMINTNLIVPMKLLQKIYVFFLQKKTGIIININSISGLEYQKLRSIYCASKWGLRGFTSTLQLEARQNNVRIINIYPSRIRTKLQFKYGASSEYVAGKIFDAYHNYDKDDIIIDKRPVKKEVCKA